MSNSSPHQIRSEIEEALTVVRRVGTEETLVAGVLLRNEIIGLLEQLEALGPDAARKVEAYDAARAQVKREGRSRAEYVLRAEHAEEQFDALRSAANAVVEAKGIYDIYDSTKAIRALRELLDSYPASEPEAK